MRQIVLDTETTGLEPQQGHKIIEIGCVELIERKLSGNHFHRYLNPQRAIDQGAQQVHGITSEFLSDKPLFQDVVEDFLAYVKDAELVIHNAPFDIGFLNHELDLASKALGRKLGKMSDYCSVLDTLPLARKMHPGQKNNLDALCKRYMVDNSRRDLHGALLDSEILAEVYLAMTGGQVNMFSTDDPSRQNTGAQPEQQTRRVNVQADSLKVLRATLEELSEHESRLDAIDKNSGGSIWHQLDGKINQLENS